MNGFRLGGNGEAKFLKDWVQFSFSCRGRSALLVMMAPARGDADFHDARRQT